MEHISKTCANTMSEDRIPGVFKLGENWAIPLDVEKPIDKRKKVVKKNEAI